MPAKIRLTIPAGIDWPALDRDPATGAILFPPGFLEGIADANNYRLPWHGDPSLPLFSEELISGLMVAWYAARREGGYPPDPVLDQLAREIEIEDGLPAGALTIDPVPVPERKN
jgi:hypothetical protein